MDTIITKKSIIVIIIITAIALAIAVITLNTKQTDYSIKQVREEFAEKLESLIKPDGTFVYEYNPQYNNEIDDYNILRHSLSTYALMNYYEENNLLETKKDKISLLIEVVKEQLIEDSNGNLFIIDSIDNEIKVGACALGLIDFCEYERLYNDDKYHDVVIKLADGILSMQRLEGRFSHVFNPDTFRLKEKDRIIYYEGEACLALCMAYEITSDEKYLNAVCKAYDYYIENGYEKYNDHWQENAVLELLNYKSEDKYLKYSIDNVASRLKDFVKKEKFANTDFELFTAIIKISKKHPEKLEKASENSEDLVLIEAELNKRKDLLKTAFYEEKTGKLNKVESFLVKNGQNHIRIDDLAHYLLGLSEKY